MHLNRRRLFACLAAAPVAAALPAVALARGGVLPKSLPYIIGERAPEFYLPSGSWGTFVGGFKAAQREWEDANARQLFVPGKCAGLIVPSVRADR